MNAAHSRFSFITWSRFMILGLFLLIPFVTGMNDESAQLNILEKVIHQEMSSFTLILQHMDLQTFTAFYTTNRALYIALQTHYEISSERKRNVTPDRSLVLFYPRREKSGPLPAPLRFWSTRMQKIIRAVQQPPVFTPNPHFFLRPLNSVLQCELEYDFHTKRFLLSVTRDKIMTRVPMEVTNEVFLPSSLVHRDSGIRYVWAWFDLPLHENSPEVFTGGLSPEIRIRAVYRRINGREENIALRIRLVITDDRGYMFTGFNLPSDTHNYEMSFRPFYLPALQ